MTAAPRLLGAVLAGGESRRFGRDKAAVRLGGETLLSGAAGALAGVCEDVVVVSSREATDRGTWRLVSDAREPCGPLGGIEAALACASEAGLDGTFVLACDLPLVDGAIAAALAEALGTREAVAPRRRGDPPFEPLCAIYRVGCLPSVRALLDEGVRAAHRLLDEVGGVIVELPQASFLNVNTVEDAARAELELRTSRALGITERP